MSDNSGTVECKKKSFSKKKVVMIVVGAFLALFLIAAIVFVCVLTDQPKIFIMSMSARHSASEFIKNKYGEKLYVEKTEPYYSTGSLFSQLAGTIVYSEDGYIVVVTDGGCSDDKQYELIKSDFCDKYLGGSALGLPVNYEAYLFEPIEGHLKIRDIAYNFNVDNNYDLFLRLDRDHYNITEKTVPLMVSDVIDYNTYYQRSGDWVGRRSYYSVDYPPYAPQSVESSPILGCDYFLDQDYLYLYIGCMKVDNLSAYLAFADIE